MKTCTEAKLADTFIIKEVDHIVGNLIASIEEVSRGNMKEIKSLQQNKVNFKAKVALTHLTEKEFTWWHYD